MAQTAPATSDLAPGASTIGRVDSAREVKQPNGETDLVYSVSLWSPADKHGNHGPDARLVKLEFTQPKAGRAIGRGEAVQVSNLGDGTARIRDLGFRENTAHFWAERVDHQERYGLIEDHPDYGGPAGGWYQPPPSPPQLVPPQ